MNGQYWWACAESYSGSGRPSRVWAQATESADVRPDDADENGDRAYPFNGMGGEVISGPHSSEREAVNAVIDMIDDDSGWLEWK